MEIGWEENRGRGADYPRERKGKGEARLERIAERRKLERKEETKVNRWQRREREGKRRKMIAASR